MHHIRMTYQELAPLLKTGDIMLMHGTGTIGEMIGVLTGSRFIHMSMIVRSEDLGMTPGQILLWESTPFTITEDAQLLKPKAGPTLVNMEARIQDEVSAGLFDLFVVRRLAHLLTADQLSQLVKVVSDVHPDAFPKTWLMFVKGAIGRFFNIEIDRKTFFCSELVAYTYQGIGLLDDAHPADFFEPKDFSTQGHLKLLCDQSFGEDIYLETGIYGKTSAAAEASRDMDKSAE
ncbi:MAG: hypothetical protein SF053_19110 [Bacteroidia bacterium]|nr:hypothetical protein [Bacteroidia bacterium]